MILDTLLIFAFQLSVASSPATMQLALTIVEIAALVYIDICLANLLHRSALEPLVCIVAVYM